MEEKNIRKLKVYEATERRKGGGWYSGGSYKTVPQIRLQGVWLEKLGYEPGAELRVECKEGKIIISKAK